MTEYVVLTEGGENGTWHLIGPDSVEARSARDAIGKVLATRVATDLTRFVAVPARSWKPVTVKVETKTALKFS